MGYMNEFPHSRMFDSDLREIIEMFEEVRKLPNAWEIYQEVMTGKFDTLKNFVENYFDNLDVSKEINSKLESMYQDGRLAELIAVVLPFRTTVEYGVVGDGIADDTEALKRLFANAGIIYIPNGTYLVDGLCDYGTLLDNVGIVVKSNSRIILAPGAIFKQKDGTNKERSIIFNINECENVIISGGHLIGDSQTHIFDGETTHEWGHGIHIRKSKNIVVEDMIIENMCGDGIYVGQTGTFSNNNEVHNYGIVLRNLNINHIGRNGIALTEADGWVIENCLINDVYRTNPKAAIDVELEGDFNPIQKDGLIKNVKCTNVQYGLLSIYNTSKLVVDGLDGWITLYENQIVDIRNSNGLLAPQAGCVVNCYNGVHNIWAVGYPTLRCINCELIFGDAEELNIEMYECKTNSLLFTNGSCKSQNSVHNIYADGYALYLGGESVLQNCCFVRKEEGAHTAVALGGAAKLTMTGCYAENELEADSIWTMVSNNGGELINNNNYNHFGTMTGATPLQGCINFKY